jgi:hypothetical protein
MKARGGLVDNGSSSVTRRIMRSKRIAAVLTVVGTCLVGGFAATGPSQAATTPAPKVIHLIQARAGTVVPLAIGQGDDLWEAIPMFSAPHTNAYYVGLAEPGDGQSIADICTVTVNNVVWYMTLERNGEAGDHYADTATFFQAGELKYDRPVGSCSSAGFSTSISGNVALTSAPYADTFYVGTYHIGDNLRAICEITDPGNVYWYLMLDLNGYAGDHFADTAGWVVANDYVSTPSCN